MNWNNAKLNEIQAIENDLIYSANCGSSSKLFTSFMHSTKEFINPKDEDEILHYNMVEFKPIVKYVTPTYTAYKQYLIHPEQMDDIIDKIAKFIELGSNLNVACTLAGYSYNVLRPKFTNEHKEKFKIARELKYKNNN
jgi:hypothetical protein